MFCFTVHTAANGQGAVDNISSKQNIAFREVKKLTACNHSWGKAELFRHRIKPVPVRVLSVEFREIAASIAKYSYAKPRQFYQGPSFPCRCRVPETHRLDSRWPASQRRGVAALRSSEVAPHRGLGLQRLPNQRWLQSVFASRASSLSFRESPCILPGSRAEGD